MIICLHLGSRVIGQFPSLGASLGSHSTVWLQPELCPLRHEEPLAQGDNSVSVCCMGKHAPRKTPCYLLEGGDFYATSK